MIGIDDLFKRGRPLEQSDIVDKYTYLGYCHHLDNYRMFSLDSLAKFPQVISGHDIPKYLFDLIAEDEVLGIANIIAGQAIYIIFRSLKEKKFFTFGIKRPMLYGLSHFHNFQYGDPIVIVEGLKDADAFSAIYPYTVAMQTAGIGLMQREILCSLTSNLILCFDNPDMDEAGAKATRRISKYYTDFDIKVLLHPQGVKDTGTLLDLEYEGKFFDKDFLSQYYYSQLVSIVGSNLDVLISKARR